jgi:glycosyltransferase involved in cell wall biosynthesis
VKLRIAYAARTTSPNGYYRAIGPMTALAELRGHRVRRLPVERNQPAQVVELGEVDVLLVHRFCEERTLRLARAAKESGAVVVWDNDDDLGAMPKSAGSHREWTGYAWEQRLLEMKRLFRYVDLVTTPSEALAERLREHGAPRVTVIENYVRDHFAHMPRPNHRGVTIGWVAGLEHQADVEVLPIRETLERLLDARENVTVASLGLGLGLRNSRYLHIASTPLTDLHEFVGEFDIGIAPLSDIPFNRSRSSVKIKEYAAAGVPWLASPIGPYAGLGEKQGGRLVPDGDWHAALSRLLDKPRERRKLEKRARRWGAGQTLSANAGVWEAHFVAAVERARAAA